MSEKLFADIAVFRKNGVPENVVKQYVQDYGLGIKKKKEATLETYSPPNYSKGVSNVPLPVGSADFGKKSDLVEKLFKRDKTNKTGEDKNAFMGKDPFLQKDKYGNIKYEQIDHRLIKSEIESNPLYKGAKVKSVGNHDSQQIITPDGVKFDANTVLGVEQFEEYMSKTLEKGGDQFARKNVALGNLSGDIDFISNKNYRLLGAQDVRGGDFSRFNENPRMMAIGYELKGDVGQEVLYKNGAPVDMGDYLYNNAGPGENWDTLPNQFQNNNPKAPGYYKMDDSLLLGYIHKNLEEEDLEKLEKVNFNNAELYRIKREKVLAENKTKYSDDKIKLEYRNSDAYKERFNVDLTDSKMSEEGLKIVKNYLSTPDFEEKAQKGEINKFLLKELSAEDEVALKATVHSRKKHKTMEDGAKRFGDQFRAENASLMMTAYLDDSVADEMGGFAAAQESLALKVESTKEVLDSRVKDLEVIASESTDKIKKQITTISKEAATLGVEIDYVAGLYVAKGGSDIDRDAINEDLSITNSFVKRANKEYDEIKDHIVNEHGKYLLQSDLNEEMKDLTNRQYGDMNLFTTNFGTRVRQMALSIPAIMGDTDAVERKAELNDVLNQTRRLVPTYDQAVASGQKWEYMVANAGDQGPNALVAIGLTVATGGSAIASPLFFGMDSAASSWVDSDVAVKSAAIAKIQLEELEANRDNMSYQDYKTAKIQLNKQVLNGDLSQNQRYGAALSSGLIEFGVQYGLTKFGLGTSGWAGKLVNNPASKELGNQVFMSGWGATKSFIGATVRDQAGELIEELSIDGLTQASNSLILGTDFTFDETWDDVAVSTLATGGMMAGGNVYTAAAQHYSGRDIRAKAKGALQRVESLHDRLASLPKDKKFDKERAGIEQRLKVEFETFGDINSEIEVAMIIGGSKNLKALAANAINLRALNTEAGVVPGDTEAQIEKKREEYAKTLNESEADSFNNRLKSAIETREDLTEVDFDNASVEEMYGETGLMIEEKLKESKDFPSQRRDQLIKIHQAVQKKAVDNRIAQYKRVDKANNGIYQAYINETVYGKADYDGKRDRKKERLVWEGLGKLGLIKKDKATTLYEKQTAVSETLLSEKELKDISIVEAEGGTKGLERAILRDPNMTDVEKDRNVKLLRQGKVNGIISNGQYITIDKVNAKKALDAGLIDQGTVISHEISHAIDAIAMTNEEQIDFSEKLERDMASRYKPINELAKKRGITEGWYVEGKPHAEQDANAKDEYTKAVQEIFMQETLPNETFKLNKERQSFTNKVSGVFGADFKFKKDQDATFYVADFIDKFNKGKLSESAKRRIKARKGSLVAFSPSSTGQITKKSSNFKGILEDFKNTEKVAEPIERTNKGLKRKLVNSLLEGAESQIEGRPFNLQNSKLAQEAGGIIESITQRLFDGIPDSELNNVTRKDYKDRLVTDLSTLIINEYEEVSIVKGKKVKNSLDTFISSRLNARANAVAKSMGIESSVDFGGVGFKVGLDKAKNVTNEDNNDTPAQTQEKQILSLRRKLGIQKGSELYNDVIDSILPSLVSAGDINSDGFKKKLMDAFSDAYVNKIKKLIGTPKSPTYKKFLNETASGVYSKMSLETLNQRFQYFTEAVVDDSGKQKRKNVEKSDKDLKVKSKTAGNAEFTKKPATKQVLEDWVNYFLNPQSVTPGVGRADSRRTSISEAIGIELGFDAMMEVLEDPANFKRFKQLSEFRGFEVADNYLSLLSKTIDRTPGTKFSMRNKNSIDLIRDHIKENVEVIQGNDLMPIVDAFVKTLPQEDQKFVKPYIERIRKENKDLLDKLAKGEITEEQVREGLTEQQALLGKKIGFDFHEGFIKGVQKISKGEVTLINLNTVEGAEEYEWGMSSFGGTLDPRLASLSVIKSSFNASVTLKLNGETLTAEGVETSLIGETPGDQDYKGDIENAKAITKVEDKVLELVKKMPKNPTPAQIKQLKNDIDKIITPKRRKALQDLRDYYYTKLNAWVNEKNPDLSETEQSIERLRKLNWTARMLQLNTNASSGIQRQGAVISSVTLDYSTTQKRGNTDKIRPFQQEHNIQLSNFNVNILKSIINENFATAYPVIADKYVQSLLDADAQVLLDSKDGKLTKEILEKYNINEGKLAEVLGKTGGLGDFLIGMDSEVLYMLALGNASRTVDLRTGLTMDKVIHNKIAKNAAIDRLDAIAKKVDKEMGNTKYSARVKENGKVIFNDATSTELFNSIITKSILGINPKSDVILLSNRIEYKDIYEGVKRSNDNILIDYKLATKKQLSTLTEYEKINKLKTLDKATKFSRRVDINPRGMSTFDFDETAGISDNFVIAKKDGKTQRIASDQWPVIGDQMVKDGWKMDFSDFNKVTNGRPGPLMQKLKNQIKKYGNKNVFILTARAAESAPAIKAYLESEGVSLPIENITGLGNSTGEAKAMWMLDKFAEGYNDMYFVDDALPNVAAVKGVLSQLDIKSKVVQTKLSTRVDLDVEINNIIEETRGIKSESRYSNALARTKGNSIGKYKFFLPPSAEDFEGLIYPMLARGKKGDAQKAFFNKYLFQPFARANRDINSAKQKVANDYRALRKQNKQASKKLKKKIPGSSFTYDHAARVYLWNKAGFEIPGLSQRDKIALAKAIEENPDVKAFADQLGVISQQEKGYTKPSENWVVETVASDLNNITQKVGRKEFLAEWIQNKNIIFSKENLNKMEATFGSQWREAMEDMLYRMENGTNRSSGGNSRLVNNYSNWVNNSVGAIMFFNGRSAVLQTLSTVNFINWGDNNPVKAAAAFANQPQYWSDFAMIFNSDMLRERRAGLKTDVNQAELAQALSGQTNKAKAALNYLLKIGFTPTQIADSFAISAGGATFYRNRVKTYLKQGMDKKAAEAKAFMDFQEIAEKTQQSSRADLISQQQASPLGRLILAFQNTPMQYTRLIKKASIDLVKGRGDWKTNISRIIYYGAVQNFIFSAMQSALFATILNDEDEEELEKKEGRIINTMIDSILRGSGLAGAAISTVKNIIMTFMKQEEKGFMADHTYTVLQAINLSPPIGSKARKLYSGIQTWRFNKDVIKHKGLSLDSPVWNGIGNVIDAGTNVPVGRVVQKLNNISEALDSQNSTWQRVALMLGWNTWDLGVEDEDLNVLKNELKRKKKSSKRKKGKYYKKY